MKKGFTLTELLAVIAIIAILAVAALSGYSAMTNNSKRKTLEQKKSQIELAAEKYAKETNMNGTATISVNRLVVMGYLQPDSSTDDGYSVITNPVNSENMICDLVTISASNDLIKASYVDGSKDCNIAKTDEVDARIDIRLYEYNRTTPDQIHFDDTTKKYDWTRDSVLLFVTSEYFDDTKYANNKAIKVTYEYGGNSVDKNVIPTNKTTTASSNKGTKYKEDTYNEFLIPIDDIGLLFDREVSVIITMKDGSTHTKSVNVRIDLEPPTGYIVVNNDFITTDSRREVKIFYDDSNGSGVAGYAISETENGGEGLNYGTTADKSIGTANGTFKIGLNGVYYIYVKDKVGNISKAIVLNNNNFDVPKDQIACYLEVYNTAGTAKLNAIGQGWYNQDIVIRAYTYNLIGSIGIKDKLLKKVHGNIQESDLTKLVKDTGDHTIIDTYTQSTEIGLTEFANGMKGLQKNSGIVTCYNENIGVDKTAPDVSFDYNKYTGYDQATQKHSIDLTFTDNLSGFVKTGSTGLAFQYGWSSSTSTEPATWISAEAVIQTDVKQAKYTITSDTTNPNNSNDKLTGTYYLWIKGGLTKDLALNAMGAKNLNYAFKFDNTAPDCTSSGGTSDWTKNNVTIKGTCTDKGSVKSGCVKMTVLGYTYDNNGNVSRTFTTEMDSSSESPGTVYDKAGNSTVCPGDRTVKIDKTAPKCTTSGGSNEWSNGTVTIKGTCEDQGTYKSGCVKKTVTGYTYDDNGNVYLDVSSENNGNVSPGTVYDKAGNSAPCSKNQMVKIDKTNPTCSIALNPASPDGENSWYKSNVTLNITSNDTGGSGVKEYGLSASNSVTYNNNASEKHTSNTSGTKWYGFVKDKAGNTNTCESSSFKLDKSNPTCTISHSGLANGDNGWLKKNGDTTAETITLTLSDNFDKIKKHYFGTSSSGSLGNFTGFTKDGTNYVKTTTQGNTAGVTYYGKVKDETGLTADCDTGSFKIDVSAPTVSTLTVASRNASYHTKKVDITVKGSDTGGSGVAKACVQVSNDVSKCTWRDFDGDDKYEDIAVASAYDGSNITVHAWIKDNAGNISAVKKASYSVYKECTDQVNDGSAYCGTYGACSLACGGGTQLADKYQKRKDKYTGASCTPITTTSGCSQPCNTMGCCSSVYYVDGDECSAECEGTYNRLAYSSYNHQRCPDEDLEEGGAACGVEDCCSQVEKECTEWEWSKCTKKKCGGGTYYQKRVCETISIYDGTVCQEGIKETQKEGTACNTNPCAEYETIKEWVYSESTTASYELDIDKGAIDFKYSTPDASKPTCTYTSSTGKVSCTFKNLPQVASLSDSTCQSILDFLGKKNANLGFKKENTCFYQTGGAPYHKPANWGCNKNPTKEYKNCYKRKDNCRSYKSGEGWDHCPRTADNDHHYCGQSYSSSHDYGCVTKGYHKVKDGKTQCWCFGWGPNKYYGTELTITYGIPKS